MKTYLRSLILGVVLLGLRAGYSQTAQFTATNTSGCSPLVVQFDGALSTGDNLIYNWDFGNGNTAFGTDKARAAASYITPGIYKVKLTVTDGSASNTIVKENFITVFGKPLLDFSTADNVTACAPSTINFAGTATSSTNLRSYTWDFGDGTSAQIANPDHTFSKPGNYTVSLIGVDNNGCINSVSKPNMVHIKEVPKADFSETGATFCKLPAKISIVDKSVNNTGEPLSYIWNFGDGSTSNLPVGEHEYKSEGKFDVKLTVSNGLKGCESAKEVKALATIQNFTAGYEVSTQGCNPLKATFTNTSNVATAPIRFTWDFGDGQSSNDISPVHDYTIPGRYTVTLLMSSPDTSCKVAPVIKQNLIVVPETGSIEFTANNTTSCALPFTTSLRDLSIGGTSWQWDFGDGQKSTERNPQHTFSSNGNYTVTLQVTEASGCVKTLKKENYIKLGAPVADFNLPAFSGCIPFNAQFTSTTQTTEPIASYRWVFGDGTSSTEVSPVHTYRTEGNYNAVLTTVTASGCTSVSKTRIITTGTKPHAEFDTTAFPIVGCKPLKFTFKNLSHSYDSLWLQPEVTSLQGKANSVTLRPGDTELTYTYVKNPAIFTPYALAFHHGCQDTFFVKNAVTILPPKAAIQYTVPSCNPGAVVFKDASAGATSVRWNFGTGHPQDTSSLRTPAFTYRHPGMYKVSITAFYDVAPHHCEDTASVYIYVPTYGAPQIDFTADKTSGCVPFVSSFTPSVRYADNKTQVAAVKWYVGNSLATSDGLPKLTFDKSGTYNVSLVVTDSRGCIDSVGKLGYIRAAGPVARMSELVPGCFPYNLSVYDSTLSPFKVTKRSWWIDSAQLNSDDVRISQVYNAPDFSVKKYPAGLPIKLKVTDEYGCSDSITKRALITQPSISFSKNIIPSCGGDTIEFSSTMTDTSGRAPFLYAWHINNTLQSTTGIKAFFPTGTNASYLKVTDASGCIDSVNLLSTVGANSSIADFTANPRIVTCWPGQVMFYDSTKSGKYGIKQWAWDFGDTTTSSLQNPSHIYTASGVYDIRLVVTDSIGCQDTIVKTDYINIKGPSGTFVVDTSYGYAPLKITFTSITKNATKFVWDYGDGNLGEKNTSEHTYVKAGTYIPKLIIEDELGCKSVFEHDTIVVMPCAPSSQKLDTTICYGASIALNASYPSARHDWNVPGDTSILVTDKAGLYVAKITIPGMPCFAYDTFKVHVVDIRFDLGPDTVVCFGESIKLNTGLPARGNVFYWSNNEHDSAQVITETGKYKLSVQDTAKYCSANDSIYVRVLPKIEANAGVDKHICIGDSVTLSAAGGTIRNWIPANVILQNPIYPSVTNTYRLMATDSLHCAEDIDEVTIFVHGPPEINVPGDTLFCSDNGPFRLDAGLGLQYEWPQGKGRSQIFEVEHGGIFHLKLYNQWNCFAEDSIILVENCPPRIFVADAFSPNNDGTNDFLHVYGAHFTNFEMVVFNRWGEIVFKSEDINAPWDGMYRGTLLPSGTYPYFIVYKSDTPQGNSETHTRKGSITLVR